ncbi:TPA: hypothetical protein ACSD8D_001404 [Escherichia coli]
MTRLAGGKATGKSAHFSQKRNATGSAKRNRYVMIEKVRKFTGFRQGCLPDSGKQFCLICAKYGVAVTVTLTPKQ